MTGQPEGRHPLVRIAIEAGLVQAPERGAPEPELREVAPLAIGHPRVQAYVGKAWDDEIDKVTRAPKGTRNGDLFDAACNLGEFVEAGLLDRETVRQALTAASTANGHVADDGPAMTENTIKSAFRKVAGKPREIRLADRPDDGDPDRYWNPAEVGLASLDPPPAPPTPSGGSPIGPGDPPDGDPPGGGTERNWDEPDDDTIRGHAKSHVKWARRFASAYTGRFLYAHGIGWHRYDGRHWIELHDGAEMRALIALIGRVAGRELPKLIGKAHEGPRKALLAEIDSVQTANALNSVLGIARNLRGISVAGENLDHDRFLVNTPTGTLDLRTGELRRSDPLDRLTKITRAEFVPGARSELFDTFLSEIQPDPQMRAFLARALGSALLGQVRDHVLHIWYGVGANGKGTLRDAVRWTLDNYGVEVPADLLLSSKYGQNAMAPEKMRLRGARVAFCSEVDQNARFNEAVMKKLTGGDPVNAKLLYRNPIEFEPSHTLFMLTNPLPKVRGDDPAIWRRILAVPFDVVVPVAQRDPELPEKLRDSADAILAWLWEGWLDYQRHGLAPPETVRQATARYQQDSDIVSRFLAEDSGQVIPNMGQTRSADLYRRFTHWCAAEGEDPGLSNKAFTEQVEGHGFKRKRTKAGAVWQGITLISEEDEPDKWYDR